MTQHDRRLHDSKNAFVISGGGAVGGTPTSRESELGMIEMGGGGGRGGDGYGKGTVCASPSPIMIKELI